MTTKINTIKYALLQGDVLTTIKGNGLAHSVDFRKYVSVLRSQGMNIKDEWHEVTNGKKTIRYKKYYMTKNDAVQWASLQNDNKLIQMCNFNKF